MSDDMVIPGVTSKLDTPKMVEALMKQKRVKLDEMKKDLETAKEDKQIWQDLGGRINKLKDTGRELFGFNNPFNEKLAESSNEKALTATATRDAFESERKITIEKIASADRFISKSLPKDYKVEAGTYQFKVGTKEISFRFSGGSLTDFAAAITKSGNNLLDAQVIKDTKDTQVIIIESLKTGSKNRLGFEGSSTDFAVKTGMLEKAQSVAKTIDFKINSPQKWENKLDSSVFTAAGSKITLDPKAEMKIPISPAIPLNKDMVMEFDVTVKDLPEKPAEKKPPGPDLPFAGDINFKGIHIENERSEFVLKNQEDDRAKKIEDMQVIFAGNGKNVIPLPEIDPKANNMKVRVPIGTLTDSLDAIYLRNKNTGRSIEIENIKIFDSKSYGEYKPTNPLSTSDDAIFYLDGIKVVRETNDIDDLVPGVKMTLKGVTNDEISLKVKRNIEAIKNSVVGFIGNYNELLGQINILTRPSEEILNALSYLTPEEKELAKKRMGMLQGDITVMQLKRNLQTIIMNPYHTGGGKELSLLAQIGISTNSAKPGTSGSIDKIKLLGYLEIDEKKLEESVRSHADWVKDLFGHDSDGDKIIDEGLAFTIDNSLKSYTQIGGFLAMKSDTYKTKIDQKNKEIRDYNEYLARTEADLKRKYAAMEGMLNNLNKSSKALDNFSKQNNGQ